jgi:hypothetical protein
MMSLRKIIGRGRARSCSGFMRGFGLKWVPKLWYNLWRKGENTMAAEALKEQLTKELENLPEDRLREVFDLVEYLRAKEGKRPAHKPPDELDPSKDPVLMLFTYLK